MNQFQTSNTQKIWIYKIAVQMKAEGLSDSFVIEAVELGHHHMEVFNLLKLWSEIADKNGKERVVSDIQDQIINSRAPLPKKLYISDLDLELIAEDIKGFKAHLRAIVDRWGGISKLAKVTKIPQPSLSRLFISGSMPKRTTLYRIAEALQLSQNEFITDWKELPTNSMV